MKKILITLIVCLTTILQSYSQTSSTTNKSKDTMVLVPVSSLKKALIILQERKNCQNEVLVARDSIKTQSEIISNLDTIVVNQSSMINLLKENNDNYKKVINNKDTEIKHFENLYVKEKRHKKMAIGGGSLLFILSIIFL